MEFVKFVPFTMKKAIAESVVDTCCVEKDGIIKYDPFIQELFFHVAFIEAYTDYRFKRNEEDSYLNLTKEYDELCMTGVMKKIIKECQEDYFPMLENIECLVKARLQENSIEGVVSRLGKQILERLDKYLSPKAIKKLETALNKLNPEVVANVLKVVK